MRDSADSFAKANADLLENWTSMMRTVAGATNGSQATKASGKA
jgi:hypothetical protein